MRRIDEVRPLTAGRTLDIWRACRQAAEDPLERTLLCNAQVVAECCFSEGAPVFGGPQEALEALTGREMESLLVRISGAEAGETPGTVNPEFDPERFRRMRRE